MVYQVFEKLSFYCPSFTNNAVLSTCIKISSATTYKELLHCFLSLLLSLPAGLRAASEALLAASETLFVTSQVLSAAFV